jgi:alkylation response protein AidB-like acyl-CoA dehydrogenase
MQSEAAYHPSRDQLALIEPLENAFTELLPLARLHKSDAETADTWRSLRELGVFGIGAPEDAGGSGLGAAEEALVVLGLGRQLASPAVLATIGAAHAGLALPEDAQVAAGWSTGGREVAVADGGAGWLLMRAAEGARLFEGPSLGAVVDDYLWGARLTAVAQPGRERAAFDGAGLLRLRLIDAAALAGLAAAALDMAVAYAGVREQFGRPIGSFQAVKHHCANMAIAARCARDQVSYASMAIDGGREDAAVQVECAFVAAAEAALESAGKNIQIHGGIGFSDEADPHLLVKRAQLLIRIGGGLEAANQRLADMRMPL